MCRSLAILVPRLLEESLGRLIDAEVDHVAVRPKPEISETIRHAREKRILLHCHVIHTCHQILVQFTWGTRS